MGIGVLYRITPRKDVTQLPRCIRTN